MSFPANFFIIIIINIYFTSSTNASSVEKIQLEPINGTSNFRINGTNGKDDKPWFDGRTDMRHVQCVRPGRCEKLTFNSCFGSKIPYTHTSLDLTDLYSLEQTKERLYNYRALQHVPRCWAVIQPFLCAVFVPKCETIEKREMVYLPSLEMCTKTLEPCRILYNSSYFPKFLKCNETLFPSKCNNDVREMKFNGTGRCLQPLVPAESQSSYFNGIEGCGVQCKDPLYTEDEDRQIHKLIGWGATLCLVCNLFVLATFFIDWQNANKYPAVTVFYINLCFFIACLGWLAQFTPGSHEDIVCRKDGTIRHNEPSAGENLSCIVVFVLVYYFLTAAMIWFVFLAYAWHLTAVGFQNRIDKKGSYFHLVSWSLPLILTITTMALSEVDGNSTVGICFVGYINHPIRSGLLLGPLLGITLIGGYFILRGMIMLFMLKNFLNKNKLAKQMNEIHLIIVRMGICVAFLLVFIFVSIMCHLTEFRNSNLWADSLRSFIICKISSTFTDEHKICKIENRPSVAILQLHLLCLFGAGIVMSSWCWTHSSIEIWKRYINKKLGHETNENIKMPKHKVIAQAWAKRKEFEDKGRLSITLYNTHTDPVGLNFDVNDLNSSATNEISSTWANYLPHCVQRRFALTGATNSSSHGNGPRKSSLDSEISFSVRHVSVESRRNSVDSQVSVKIAEMKTKVARSSRSKHSNKSNKSRNRRDIFAAATGRKGRRESSTSMESQVIAVKKTSYPNKTQKVGLFSHSKTSTNNSKRRSANAGIDPPDFSKLLTKNGQFILPFLQNQGLTTTSDEDDCTSMKIQDSRLDVVLRHMSDDDNDEEDNDGLEMEEFIQTDDEINNIKKGLPAIQKSMSLDNILNRNSKDRYDSPSRQSKNSNKSRLSRKSGNQNNHSLRNGNHKRKSNKRINTVGTTNISVSKIKDSQNYSVSNKSISCSGTELDLPIVNNNNNSYSGISLSKISRNSKTSCDIGIQADPIDIVKSSLEHNDIKKSMMQKLNSINNRINNDNGRNFSSDEDESTQECHQLIPMKYQQNGNIMSESDRLKMLLLPSK